MGLGLEATTRASNADIGKHVLIYDTSCMEMWKRMFHGCDFNGTILDFPDATDATKTYPIGTWSTPKILKFICPRFGQ